MRKTSKGNLKLKKDFNEDLTEIKHHKYGSTDFEKIEFDSYINSDPLYEDNKYKDDLYIENENKKRKSICHSKKKSTLSNLIFQEKGVMIKKPEFLDHNEKEIGYAFYRSEDDNVEYPGQLYVSDFRIKFEFLEDCNYDKVYLSRDYFSILKFLIAKIEKSQDKFTQNRFIIEFFTKDNRNFKLSFKVNNENNKLYDLFQEFAFISDSSEFFKYANRYYQNYSRYINKEDNKWVKFDLIKEMERQNVDLYSNMSRYRVSEANKSFRISLTYPKILIVPRFFTDGDIINCSAFRSKGRIPLLCWQYKENKCCIWRCSQPLPGIMQNRNSADEKLLKSIVDYSDRLIIYDARPYLNALANRVRIIFNILV
jgi:hypothetical protein